MRAINILTHVFKPPAVNPNLYGAKLDKFISSVFIQDMKRCFEENSYSKDGEHDSQIMVAVNGTVYEIGDDFSWAHDETGVYAIGSGSGYAMGAMLASLDNKKKTLGTAKNVIRQAITIAAKLDPSTGLPINILVQHFGS
jgi:ATP-dependent protease HslVU (ClpYQ) peptidase subunit